MIIGTTPTFIFKLKRACDANLLTAQSIFVTFKQGTTTLTKSGLDVNIIDTKTVKVKLTQQESLAFSIDKKVEVQLNWMYVDVDDNNTMKRAATKVVTINLEK